MLQYIQKFLKKSVAPISQNEDDARREFILNVLLLSIVVLSFSAFVISLIGHLLDGLDASMPTSIILIILSFFIFLYFLSRKGLFLSASFIFLGIFFILNSYTAITYGVDVPEGVLTYALIIIMSGVLIGTRFAFFSAATTIAIILFFGYLQVASIFPANSLWKIEKLSVGSIIFINITFIIIATVSWLSNREIEKSLARARRSEADLKKERDSLEITVETRTRELKETQAEKMTQLYRFAEFGRLSSGLFHDLINPLTAVSLNIEKIKDLEQNIGPHIEFAMQKTDITPISETAIYVDKAIVAAKKMEDMVSAVRKQLSREENKAIFSLNSEIGQAIDVLSHKAMKACVKMRFQNGNEIKTYGDAVKFNQVALNLVVNAIDAGGKTVEISLTSEKDEITLSVKDDGTGIKEENKPKLFEPFFTTKEEGYGLGIGLSMTKRIIEKDFGGNIEVSSKEGEGSTFTVKFPQKQNE